MRTPHLAPLVLGLAFAVGCTAPRRTADEEACLDAVQGFFDVIATSDAEAGAALMVPEGAFVSVRARDGERSLRSFTNADWLARMGEQDQAYFEAFDGEPTVLVDGDVAVVWGRYVFDVDGARSHVGTDAFTLVRTDAGWRIAGGAYTVEATGEVTGE